MKDNNRIISTTRKKRKKKRKRKNDFNTHVDVIVSDEEERKNFEKRREVKRGESYASEDEDDADAEDEWRAEEASLQPIKFAKTVFILIFLCTCMCIFSSLSSWNGG